MSGGDEHKKYVLRQSPNGVRACTRIFASHLQEIAAYLAFVYLAAVPYCTYRRLASLQTNSLHHDVLTVVVESDNRQ
jgi:hypothetical protein